MTHRPLSVLLAAITAALGFAAATAAAQPVYLNDDAGVTVALGASMPAEPFQNRTTASSLASIIDLDNASVADTHAQSTHVWITDLSLELDFDLGASYDLTTMHFWNYFTESFDVDDIDMIFFDEAGTEIGQILDLAPSLSAGNPVTAENIEIAFPSGVRFINMTLSGTNGEVDFQNIGFTGTLVPPAPTCPGDIADDFGTLGSDGMVSFGDFLALLGLVGPCPGGPPPPPGCPGDIADDFGTLPPLGGSDGMVSFGDFLALLGLVGPCP